MGTESRVQLGIEPLTLNAVTKVWDEIGDDPDTWQWIAGTEPIPRTLDAIRQSFNWRIAEMKDAEFLYVFDKDSKSAVAISAFLDIRPEDRHVEIGSTFIAPRFRGGKTNYELKLLMLTEAFEKRDCVRVTFKVNTLNERSKAAVSKIGATFEGEIRNQKLMRDGSWRTVALYSILIEEWPSVKAHLEKLIAS